MDVFAVPQKNSVRQESGAQSQNASASGEILAASFNDILRNAGGRLDSDATSLMARVDQSIASQQPAPTERSSNSDPERRDDYSAEKSDFGNRRTDGSDEYGENDTQRAAIYDDRSGDAGNPSNSSDYQEDGPAGSASSNTDDRNADQRTEGNGAENAADTDDANGSNSGTENAPSAEKPTQNASSNSTSEKSTDDQATTEFTANVLATQLFTNRDVSGVNTAQSSGKNSAAGEIRTTATAAVSDMARGPANQFGPEIRTQTQAQGQANGNATANQTPQQMAGDISANGSDGKSQPTTDPLAIVGDAAKAMDGKSQQAATLSRMVGEGNAVSVRSAADAIADTLISRPSATLSAATATAAETTKPAAAMNPNAATNTLAAAATGAEVNPMAAAERAAAQAAGAQGGTAANAAARGIAQLASTANSGSGQAQTGGGENFQGSSAQSPGQASASQQASQTRAPGAPRFTLPQQSAVDQVSVQITKALNAGFDRINIQLRPANMGRVDVRMELGADGRVSAVVTADNKETLEMLQRDSRDLERALQDAGLNTDQGSLSFNLREQNPNGQDGENAGTGVADASADDDDGAAEPNEPMASADYAGGIRSDGRVDIRA